MHLRRPRALRFARAPVARTTVASDDLRHGLARIAALDLPPALRATIADGSLELTRYDADGGWWASTAVPIRANTHRGATTVVPTTGLQNALQLSVGATDGHDLDLVVQGDAGVKIGNVVVPPAGPALVPMPHGFEGWELVEVGIALPAVAADDGETTFRFSRGAITMSNAALRRMARRAVADGRAFMAEGHAFVAGASDHDPSVMVFAPARVLYDRTRV